MGLIDKIKDLFTDEVVETPVKKDVIKVEIPAPIKESKNEEETDIADSEFLIKEEKNIPVFFNDKDFEDIEPKRNSVAPIKSSYRIKRSVEMEKTVEKKVFKPSPIISPVYGILNKDYYKEDISSKKRTSYYQEDSNKNITIDDVRNKAFGTLEDELKQELSYTQENDISENETLFFKNEFTEESDLFENVESFNENLDESFNEVSINDADYADNMDDSDLTNEINNVFESEEKVNESDLFDLIDSMYEKGEDK